MRISVNKDQKRNSDSLRFTGGTFGLENGAQTAAQLKQAGFKMRSAWMEFQRRGQGKGKAEHVLV
jgi:hypothetical protein